MLKSSCHSLLDPSVFSCFSTSYPSIIFNRLKWSTVSISISVLIIILYATSGLSTLIDVKTLSSIDSLEGNNVTIPLMTDFASMAIHLRWISVCVYFSVVILVILLICGIQWSQPWLIFIWSIMMIIMLLLDGIVTVLTIRHDDQQIHRPSEQSHILSILLIIRLSISLIGIFLSIFHFRGLSKAKLEYADRQRMLNRYNAESRSISNQSSWAQRGVPILPNKDLIVEQANFESCHPITYPPHATLATIQRHPISTLFNARHSYQSQGEPSAALDQQPRNDFNPTFQYSRPSQERFQQKINNEQEL